ncbi:NUDIX domain-containing protein [Halieaceae bacterium IMCC14734]|uniref:ADP-ribose pyrophosphatase n=1 Tax=Candidatus Litorirhabdus singularis TaxID=2518993 RepID=A0ABT3TLP0_9GAMM|nr:NUDIX domain-containing protein [Candidatus Litorirhabdus singularis]MCX2983215.1 NUDIX domain-containing protein [Candidatus Litorirhabdus singularis]
MEPEFGAEDVRILEQPSVFSGYFSVRKVVLQHRLFAGGWSHPITREVFDRGDAVGVLPWDPVTDELIMIEQFRVGAVRNENNPWMLELVAGVVEPGENDEEVARREAIEEAALSITELHPIARFYPSAGACSEQVRLFVGRATRPQQSGVYGCDEEDEDIRVHVLTRAEVMALLNAGRIDNGHTLIALLWLQHHGDALREQWLT